ncbi:MAG: hypothetical protein ACR2QF_08655 [Geminicoccaceae bacterium]
MSKREYDAWQARETIRKERQGRLVWMFFLSLLIFPTPITTLVSLITVRRNHDLLVGEGGAFLALGYGTVLVGLLYMIFFATAILTN